MQPFPPGVAGHVNVFSAGADDPQVAPLVLQFHAHWLLPPQPDSADVHMGLAGPAPTMSRMSARLSAVEPKPTAVDNATKAHEPPRRAAHCLHDFLKQHLLRVKVCSQQHGSAPHAQRHRSQGSIPPPAPRWQRLLAPS